MPGLSVVCAYSQIFEKRTVVLCNQPHIKQYFFIVESDMKKKSNTTYLSLLGVWTDSCPFVEACGFIIKEVFEEAEDEIHVVGRSKLL